MSPVVGPDEIIRIAPRARWGLPDVRELWKSRDLLYLLSARNVRVRYKQTILGASWALLQPLLTTVVFTVIFGGLADIPSDDVPYYLFSLASMVPFTYFATSFEQSANSLVSEASLITKIYFPRIAVPASFVLSGLVDLAVGLVALLLVVLVAVGAVPIQIILLPVLILIATFTAIGAGLLLAAMNVQFRDVRYTLPLIRQLWLFITPIAYPASLIDEPWRTLYAINPMVGVVEGFRWALLPVSTQPANLIIVSGLSSVVLLLIGGLFFRRTESYFADVV